MTKQPLRSIPPAPMPARRMYTSEAAARKAAPKPGKGQRLEVVEVSPGFWAGRLVAKASPVAMPPAAKPKRRSRPSKVRSPIAAAPDRTAKTGDDA